MKKQCSVCAEKGWVPFLGIVDVLRPFKKSEKCRRGICPMSAASLFLDGSRINFNLFKERIEWEISRTVGVFGSSHQIEVVAAGFGAAILS